MFACFVFSSTALTPPSVSWYQNKPHLRACQTSHFPVSPRPSRRVLSVTNMASNNQPPQKQDTQPGKEHVMNPIPQFTSPDYIPSNKLRVWQLWLIHIFLISIIHDI